MNSRTGGPPCQSLYRDCVAGAEQRQRGQELHACPRGEGHRGAEVSPQPARAQSGGRQEPDTGRDRLQHGEPVLLRYLQNHRSGRARTRLRSSDGQYRLPFRAIGHQCAADDRAARDGPGGDCLGDGARADRRAQREQHSGSVLRRRHVQAQHHQHPRGLPPRHRKDRRLSAQHGASAAGIRGAPCGAWVRSTNA